jgi:hypothetical protein
MILVLLAGSLRGKADLPLERYAQLFRVREPCPASDRCHE